MRHLRRRPPPRPRVSRGWQSRPSQCQWHPRPSAGASAPPPCVYVIASDRWSHSPAWCTVSACSSLSRTRMTASPAHLTALKPGTVARTSPSLTSDCPRRSLSTSAYKCLHMFTSSPVSNQAGAPLLPRPRDELCHSFSSTQIVHPLVGPTPRTCAEPVLPDGGPLVHVPFEQPASPADVKKASVKKDTKV